MLVESVLGPNRNNMESYGGLQPIVRNMKLTSWAQVGNFSFALHTKCTSKVVNCMELSVVKKRLNCPNSVCDMLPLTTKLLLSVYCKNLNFMRIKTRKTYRSKQTGGMGKATWAHVIGKWYGVSCMSFNDFSKQITKTNLFESSSTCVTQA